MCCGSWGLRRQKWQHLEMPLQASVLLAVFRLSSGQPSGEHSVWCLPVARRLWLSEGIRTTSNLTCFHASFFPFCPLCWPPLFLPFSRRLFAPFLPSKNALFCRARGTAQRLGRGSFRTDPPTKFGKEFPSRNLRKNRSEMRFCCSTERPEFTRNQVLYSQALVAKVDPWYPTMSLTQECAST